MLLGCGRGFATGVEQARQGYRMYRKRIPKPETYQTRQSSLLRRVAAGSGGSLGGQLAEDRRGAVIGVRIGAGVVPGVADISREQLLGAGVRVGGMPPLRCAQPAAK